jgi:hypothetical protein
MAVTLNASNSGTGGLSVTSDATGNLAFQTAGTTAVTVDTNQRVAFVAGTAALPAITTSGDTNTGIFFSAADTIDFTEGGTATGQFDSSGNFKFNSGYGSVATAYGCRAWANWNGTTGTIRGSGNVSSTTRSSTGTYVVTFTNAMPDANYAVASIGNSVTAVYGRNIQTNGTQASGSVTVVTDGLAGLYDVTYVYIAIFR